MSKNMECKLSLLYLGEGREDDEDEEKKYMEIYSMGLWWKGTLRPDHKEPQICGLKVQTF